jgi:hypothetical protein
MSRIDDWSEAEKQLYAIGSRAILDDIERQAEEWRESWALDSTSMDEMTRKHNERMRQLEEDHKQWLTRFLRDASGAADEGPQPTQDVRGQAGASAGSSLPASPAGPGREQPSLTADDIKAMSMQDYQALRARTGLGNASGRGMFG